MNENLSERAMSLRDESLQIDGSDKEQLSEQDIKLLKLALSIGSYTIDKIYYALDYCEDVRNDYWTMCQKLSEIIDVNLDDVT